jgi:hypothetical protein
MTDQTKRALLTVAMAPGELRVLKVVARCRNTTMTAMIRELLVKELLVDLERR